MALGESLKRLRWYANGGAVLPDVNQQDVAVVLAEVERLNGLVTGLRCGYRDLRALAQWIADGYDKHRHPDAVARLVLKVYPDTPPSEDECQRLLAMRHEAHSE